jgi:molybdopterin converting factor small subunit
MTINVLLFARYRESAGRDSVQVEVPAGATLGEVWERVMAAVPSLRDEIAPLMACDRVYARRDRTLRGTEEVAMFPPVSGG